MQINMFPEDNKQDKPQFKLPLIDPPFNYSGNKHKLLTQLFPHFDYSKNTLVDLFTGGGAIYVNSLENYDHIIANDIISDLIETHKGIILSDDIINETISLCVPKNDKEGYMKLRTSYNEDKTPAKLYALILCCNCNMIRFNKKGMVNSTTGNGGYNKNIEKKLNIFKHYVRQYKDKINLISKNYYDVEINKDSFYYIDILLLSP
jgi:site-specific DNA-adenine methylase